MADIPTRTVSEADRITNRRLLKSLSGDSEEPRWVSSHIPGSNIKREKMAERYVGIATEIVENSGVVDLLRSEIPNKNGIDLENAEVYEISHPDRESPIFQIVVPLTSSTSELYFATDGMGFSAGLELDDGRFVFVESDRTTIQGPFHAFVPEEDERGNILECLNHNEDYARAVNSDDYEFKFKMDDSAVSILEEQSVAHVLLPYEGKTKTEMEGEGGLLHAKVNTDSLDLESMEACNWECISNCLQSDYRFWGVCFSVCHPCAYAPNPYTCAPCASCLGIGIGACTGGCCISW